MDAVKFLKERKRMCKSLGESCTGCMINIKKRELRCFQFCEKYPEKAVAIVEEWTKEHPEETRLTRLLKNYPNTPLLNEDGIPVYVCASHLGLMEMERCTNRCVECWNTALEEE
ncbi:hypothetical protein [Anaerotignum faecicola]